MKIRLSLAMLFTCAGLAAAAPAADQSSASAALKGADATAAQAAAAGVQWTSTVALLKAAHTADGAGDFAAAQTQAQKAQAMAKLSMQEAHEQKSLWRAQVIQ